MFHFLKRRALDIWHDQLHRNSLLLMANTVLISAVGMLFWIVVTNLYSPADVGLATVLISIISAVTSWSLFGFNVSLVRYLPTTKDSQVMISSVFIVVGAASVLIALLFVIFLPNLFPAVNFLRQNYLILLAFLCFVPLSAINSLSDSIFTALRAPHLILIVNSLMSLLKLLLPFIFVALGAWGIVSGVTGSIVAAMILSIFLIKSKFGLSLSLTVNLKILKRISYVSISNYFANILSGLPSLVLPLIVLNKLGAQESAYFYMPTMIITVLNTIPRSITQSLLTECAYQENNVKQLFTKSIKTTVSLFIPAILVLILLGNYILLIFGKEFSSEGFRYLQWVAAGSLFGVVGYFSSVYINIRHEGYKIVLINLFSASVIVALSLLFVEQGITGLGIASFISQVLIALFNLIIVKVDLTRKKSIILDKKAYEQNI